MSILDRQTAVSKTNQFTNERQQEIFYVTVIQQKKECMGQDLQRCWAHAAPTELGSLMQEGALRSETDTFLWLEKTEWRCALDFKAYYLDLQEIDPASAPSNTFSEGIYIFTNEQKSRSLWHRNTFRETWTRNET